MRRFIAQTLMRISVFFGIVCGYVAALIAGRDVADEVLREVIGSEEHANVRQAMANQTKDALELDEGALLHDLRNILLPMTKEEREEFFVHATRDAEMYIAETRDSVVKLSKLVEELNA